MVLERFILSVRGYCFIYFLNVLSHHRTHTSTTHMHTYLLTFKLNSLQTFSYTFLVMRITTKYWIQSFLSTVLFHLFISSGFVFWNRSASVPMHLIL